MWYSNLITAPPPDNGHFSGETFKHRTYVPVIKHDGLIYINNLVYTDYARTHARARANTRTRTKVIWHTMRRAVNIDPGTLQKRMMLLSDGMELEEAVGMATPRLHCTPTV